MKVFWGRLSPLLFRHLKTFDERVSTYEIIRGEGIAVAVSSSEIILEKIVTFTDSSSEIIRTEGVAEAVS